LQGLQKNCAGFTVCHVKGRVKPMLMVTINGKRFTVASFTSDEDAAIFQDVLDRMFSRSKTYEEFSVDNESNMYYNVYRKHKTQSGTEDKRRSRHHKYTFGRRFS
jgi:hypothetical protein